MAALVSIYVIIVYMTSTNGCNVTFCPPSMIVNWIHMPPYVHKSSHNSTTLPGLLRNLAEDMMRKCCGECVQFDYVPPLLNQERLAYDINDRSSNSSLNLPVSGSTEDTKYNHFPYFPLVESPGFIFFQNTKKSEPSDGIVTKAVVSGWPILILTLVMAVMSGLIIWSIDTYWNPDHFPHLYSQGIWEGFWWAFVTMTTVGYGDRAPRSFHARMYAFFWILIGLVIIGLFIGSISSTLTSYCLNSDVEIIGKSVVVLNETAEHRYLKQNSGNPVPVTTIKQFVVKLKEDPSMSGVDGGLLDAYVAGHYERFLSEVEEVEFASVFYHEYTLGMVLTLDTFTPPLHKCLRKYRHNNENQIIESLLTEMKAFHHPERSSELVRSESLISSKSKTFQYLCYACAVISVVLLLLSALLFRSRILKKEEANKVFSLTSTRSGKISKKDLYCHLYCEQCNEMEQFVTQEVLEFYERFKKGLDTVDVNNGCTD